MVKGEVSPLVVAFLAILTMIALGAVAYILWLAVKPPVPVIKYIGELEDVFLPTEAWFASELTEYIDCNITDDILGKDYASCVFRTGKAWNGTADPAVEYKDWEFSLVLEVSDAVQGEIEAYLVNEDTGQAKDDAMIRKAEIWTHEEEPTKIATLPIEELWSVDTTFTLPEGGEYVLYFIVKTKDIDPDFITGDNIMKIDIDLTAEAGDVDEGHILIESA